MIGPRIVATGAALLSVALAVLAGVLGVALLDPADPPSLEQRISEELELVPEASSDEYLYVATRGPAKGQSVAAQYAITVTHAVLVAKGATKGHYVHYTCSVYTDTGRFDSSEAKGVQVCTTVHLTAQQVRHALGVSGPPLAA